MSDTQGGCLCGQIRYSFAGDPLVSAVCHCTHCQKQGGSAFSVVSAVAEAAYTQTGETRVYRDQGESGQAVYRHFCGNCGSPIASIADAIPGLILIKAGTIDGGARFAPSAEAYCDSKLSWVPAIEGATPFPRSNI